MQQVNQELFACTRFQVESYFSDSFDFSKRKIFSIGSSNNWEIKKLVGKLGSNFSFSMALIVCLETPIIEASSY
jgi:hypothetical protein